MIYAIRNVSTVQGLTTPVLAMIANALEYQLNQQFCPAWEQTPGRVIVTDDPKAVAATAVITIYDDADQQGELGDHELVAGLATGRIFARTILSAGGEIAKGDLSVSGTLSHELLEIGGDPYADWWSDHPSGDVVALEACDPVEDQWYEGEDGVAVSDFVTPRWFRGGPGPFNWLRNLRAPFDVTSGGYIILRDAGPQFGERVSSVRKAMKLAPGSRTRRRAPTVA